MSIPKRGQMGIYEQAFFSQRLRTRDLPEWCEFLRLWTAFNCLYGEDHVGTERDRAMRVVKKYLSSSNAQLLLEQSAAAAYDVIATPPGDMRKDLSDPQFREQTVRCADAYSDQTKQGNERLAGLIGVIYQVRCNLLHGDKNPDDARDILLVRKSNAVLQVVLPALEDGIRMTA